jgi:23S rRNA pseudouridine2605 synthase
MGAQVTEGDTVVCDGRRVRPTSRNRYFVLHKPVRVICTQRDEAGRKKAIEFFAPKDVKGLFHVGRLDFMSSGLIFFTNDGEFAKIVTHPSYEVEKEYLLECSLDIPPAMLEEYVRGIKLEGETLTIASYRFQAARTVSLILRQGRNREIRRVCRHFNLPIRRLTRVRIGCVGLSPLAPGAYRPLTEREIGWFLSLKKRART